MKRCLRCFHSYEEEYEICPHCGYAEGTQVDEPQYLHPGTVLQNRYQIGVVIGAGGFGITYGAWDSVLEQRVAIKEYMPGEFSTRAPGETQVSVYGGEKEEQFEAGKNKFYEESKRLAKFQDVPGIVQIYNSFEENATAYIVMEYLEGETLAERLRREKKIPEEEAVQLILPVLQALEAVHREGILHRDIAPNNIFLTKDGGVKLLDFGAARNMVLEQGRSLTILYKEGYTPEEQYRSHGEQGAWTDVYAAAATLYKMVTGEVPAGALERRRKDTLKAPSRAGARVSKRTEQAILNALNVDARYRTQSAGQLIAELTGDGKIQGHFVRTMERRVGRIPLPVKIAAGVAVAGMACFLGLLFAGVIDTGLLGFGLFAVPEGMARVPNVVNESVEEARSVLEESTLELEISGREYSEKIPEGKILSQSVRAGKIVEQGTMLSVVLSSGSEMGVVPDVRHQHRDDAMSELVAAGFTVEVEYDKTAEAPDGEVLNQSAAPGEEASKSEPVTLTVKDFVVDWTNAEPLEEYLRIQIGKLEGDVYASDLYGVTQIDVDMMGEATEDDRIDLEPVINCVNLERLSVVAANFWEEPTTRLERLSKLKALGKLEGINFVGMHFSDTKWMEGLRSLKRISNQYSVIEHLNADIELENLIRLSFYHTKIEAVEGEELYRSLTWLRIPIDIFRQIQNREFLQNLQELEIDDYNMEGLGELGEAASLQSLTIAYAEECAAIDFSELASFTKIRSLSLEFPAQVQGNQRIVLNGQDAFARMGNLREVELRTVSDLYTSNVPHQPVEVSDITQLISHMGQITDLSIKLSSSDLPIGELGKLPFGGIDNLQSLEISTGEERLSIGDVEGLEHLKTLSLRLWGTDARLMDKENLRQLNGLETLILYNEPALWMGEIDSSLPIKTLQLDGSSGYTYADIAKLENVETLVLSNTDMLEMTDLASLKEMKNLKTLAFETTCRNMNKNQVLQGLLEVPQLEHLYLRAAYGSVNNPENYGEDSIEELKAQRGR
ncbi:MAG: PASTA domain-containing protein [Eubacteriales bacterium]|nr:PASTA domain-containing protein [Eubacteriales bacterium]